MERETTNSPPALLVLWFFFTVGLLEGFIQVVAVFGIRSRLRDAAGGRGVTRHPPLVRSASNCPLEINLFSLWHTASRVLLL
ncbi:hypothetical protein QBC47DRAFT_177373 [Echria macrotheca]|uniref:Uncharacterized protein n=1 Tax=Echria macrotheca TaxID=438768 RepID=A0AAJ0FD53_9PEZI|nr:hypothetical protein QBC47DRAFT_177373 [Echria macrotheca]